MTTIINAQGFQAGDGSLRNSFGRAILADVQPTNTAGGASQVGASQTRNLNTILVNEIGLTLSNNAFMLQPGQYYLKALVPHFNSGNTRAWIDTNPIQGKPVHSGLLSPSDYNYSGSTSNLISQGILIVEGRLIVSVATSYFVRQFTQLGGSQYNLGVANNLGTDFPEVFTRLYIDKEK